ncbi:MAG: TRAP transporter small permease [Flavobacteriales bacterium]|nr:TRAP transporter small permease [Flavobacteriales bacterium]
MKITTWYLKLNGWFERLEKVISVVIILSIVLVVFAGTVSRYAFNLPLYGVDRLGTYLMIWLGFIGFQIATSKIRHIEVEFVKSKVSIRTKCMMNMFINFIAAIVIFIFALLSYKYTILSMEFNDKDPVLGIPMWWVIMIIPISFVISSVRFLFTIFLWLDVLQGKRLETDFVNKQIL